MRELIMIMTMTMKISSTMIREFIMMMIMTMNIIKLNPRKDL